jgi:putative Holliday junction resolvase
VGRIAGIDFGAVRIGVALSDPGRILASPLTCVFAGRTLEETVRRLSAVLPPIDAAVVGLPLHLSGADSPLCAQVRAFAALLEAALSVPVVLWDERLTTAQVERTLKEAHLSRKKRAPLVDALSATVLLQNHLDTLALSANRSSG